MAKRTYAPTFIALLRRLCVYIIRYQNTLVAGLTDAGVSNAQTKVSAVVAACENITVEYVTPINP
jgi:hypothetical protein